MLPVTRRSESPFDLIQREIDRAFDRLWGMGGDGGYATAAYPVDIREEDEAIYVEAELPGFKKDQVEVSIEQGVLTINAAREEEKKEKEKGVRHLHERRFTRVSRSFRLPVAVDENKVEAKLDQGVLMLRLPKREEVKPRRIEVK
ncbi:MAG TPA: Hsp20/alpha crystallin family protein [Phycisphaeraceae bacterium]